MPCSRCVSAKARAPGRLRGLTAQLHRAVDGLGAGFPGVLRRSGASRRHLSCRSNQRCRSKRPINGDAMRRFTICGSRAAEGVGCTFNIFTGMLPMAGAERKPCASLPSSCSISAAVSNWWTASVIASCAVFIPTAISSAAAPADRSTATTSAMTKSSRSPCALPIRRCGWCRKSSKAAMRRGLAARVLPARCWRRIWPACSCCRTDWG